MLGLPAPFVPHSASLSPTTATRVLSTPVPVSAPPTGLDECLFSISLVLDPLAVRFSVSSGCARRRSVSTYAAILVLYSKFLKDFYSFTFLERGEWRKKERRNINVFASCVPPALGTRPATQACAPNGNQSSHPLVYRPALNPLNHTSQVLICNS